MSVQPWTGVAEEIKIKTGNLISWRRHAWLVYFGVTLEVSPDPRPSFPRTYAVTFCE